MTEWLTPADREHMLTLGEVAAILDVQPRTVFRYVAAGFIVPFRSPLPKTPLYFRRDEVEKLLPSRPKQPPP